MTHMPQTTITDDQFVETYKPVANHLVSDASFNGCMFETYGPELDHVLAIDKTEPLRVWTIQDCDGLTVISSGYHLVNRIGYLISEVPAPADALIEAFDPDEKALLEAEEEDGDNE